MQEFEWIHAWRLYTRHRSYSIRERTSYNELLKAKDSLPKEKDARAQEKPEYFRSLYENNIR